MKKSHFTIFAAAISTLFIIGCSGPSKPVSPSDQILDNDIFKQATDSGDSTRCKDILDDELKTSCEQVIGNFKIINEAASSLDKSKCKKISDERYKDDCEKQVEAKLEAKNADAKRLSVEQEAINDGDAALCDEIADENQKVSCKYNILANQAIQNKDQSICKLIGDEESIAKCEQNF